MTKHASLLQASLFSLSLLAGATAAAEPAQKAAKPAAADAKSDAIASFKGKYKYVGAKSEKKVISDQIDEILWKLDDSMRMPAKERLEMKTRIAEWVEVKQNGSKFTILFEGRKPDELSLDGPTSGMDPEGNPAQLKLERDGNKLIHSITTAEGTRTITYEPQADGSLKVDQELKGPRLLKPFRWSLTYKKGK